MWQIWDFNYDTKPAPFKTWLPLAGAGAGLFLSSLLIFIMPELVAYLVATFLLWGSLAVFALAWRARKLEKVQVHTASDYQRIW